MSKLSSLTEPKDKMEEEDPISRQQVSDSTRESLTCTTWMAAICGCFAGFSYGYETTLASGLIVMPQFYKLFFRDAIAVESAETSPYCVDLTFSETFYVSIIFLIAAVIAPVSGLIANKWGRRNTFLAGSWILLTSSILKISAMNSIMIWLGRVILGIAIALLTTVAPMYLAEMSPANYRGRFGASFNMSNAFGQCIAFLVNKAVGSWNNPNSWRISFACGMCSSLSMLVLLHFFLPGALHSDTPSSLLYRGKMKRAEEAFTRIRCINRIESNRREWEMMREEALKSITLIPSSGAQRSIVNWSKIKKVFTIVPAFTIMFHLSVVRMWTGCAASILFTAAIFKATGSSTSWSLLAQLLVGVGTIVGSITSVLLFDRVGRCRSLIGSAAMMSVCTALSALLMGIYLDPAPGSTLPSAVAIGLLATFVGFQFFFFAAWAASYWVITSEVYPLAIRSAASGVGMFLTFMSMFVSVVTVPPLMCSLRYGAFIFFACINAYLVFFSRFLLLETKGKKLQEIETMWRRHPVWKKALAFNEDLEKLDQNDGQLPPSHFSTVKSNVVIL